MVFSLGYYDAIVAICSAALSIMMVLVQENGRMGADTKKRLYMTYGILFLAMLMERFAVLLNGAPEWTRWIHAAAKCLDYIFTPVVGMMFIRQMAQKGRYYRFIYGILVLNILLQTSSLFTGWTFYLDAENYYHHGTLYILYTAIYVAVMLLAVVQFRAFGQQFRQQNHLSLYLTVALVFFGIVVQELTGTRLSYLTLTMGAVLLFIHNNEFNQQQKDDVVSEQRHQLNTDPMTGLLNRYAYTNRLNELTELSSLPADTVVFALDINGLKAANDTYGHQAGDELITGLGRCIQETFEPDGECYRTGGDEFVVILRADEKRISELSETLTRKVNAWKPGYGRSSGLSFGAVQASEYPEHPIEALISIADERMYEQKSRYYR